MAVRRISFHPPFNLAPKPPVSISAQRLFFVATGTGERMSMAAGYPLPVLWVQLVLRAVSVLLLIVSLGFLAYWSIIFGERFIDVYIQGQTQPVAPPLSECGSDDCSNSYTKDPFGKRSANPNRSAAWLQQYSSNADFYSS
ncbi:hypothetical protein QBC33DRAFT_559904 [Phialemonium atrogriseum]|uniref:Uncharacterized protein n=1 Tax=Phialemonium atrogriseum TaxID=1093897 RepID=A0AAJ0BZA0_9PEZI|nr:uncharacterized protein QBC33DRAFT_559904 [Phialemonium atrogriseum]KAK1766592.1 hypothetical protein QBC33DRAFT_559904 [Phialemonium atrogriseum]